MGVSGTEKEVLKAVEKRGGETNLFGVAAEIGMSTDYARILCTSLGIRDFVDLTRSGKVKLTPKGWKALGKTPKGQGWYVVKERLSPEEKYKRWANLSEGKGQRTEIRRQKSEVRNQRSENRGQKTENRGQKSEDRKQKIAYNMHGLRMQDKIANPASSIYHEREVIYGRMGMEAK